MLAFLLLALFTLAGWPLVLAQNSKIICPWRCWGSTPSNPGSQVPCPSSDRDQQGNGLTRCNCWQTDPNYFECMVCGNTTVGTYSQVCDAAAPVPTPAPASECSNPPRNSCIFYADCLESRYHCASTHFNYPIGYGLHFCQKFIDNTSQFSPQGQKWILDTMQCLQKALIPEASGQVNTTCQALSAKAFGTHTGCYINSGFCSLPCADWGAVENVVGFQTLFQNWDALLQALETAAACPKLVSYVLFGICS